MTEISCGGTSSSINISFWTWSSCRIWNYMPGEHVKGGRMTELMKRYEAEVVV